MVIRHFLVPHRYWTILVICCLIGIAAGGALALKRTGAGGPSTTLIGNGTLAPPGTPDPSRIWLSDPGSPDVMFPPSLSLGGQPSDLAVDNAGNVWVVFTTAEGKFVLARASSDNSELTQYSLPADDPAAAAHIAIAGSGDLIIAVGKQVLRVDSGTLEFKAFDLALPKSSSDGVAPPGARGVVTQLRVEGDSAFVSTFGLGGITELSLATGNTNYISVPSSFGGYDDFLVSADKIWLIKTGDTLGGPASQIGSLDRSTGALQTTNIKVRSAGLYKNGLAAVTWDRDGVIFIDDTGTHPVPEGALNGPFIGKLGIEMPLVADSKGGVWITDVTRSSIAWLDPSSGASYVYALPIWAIPATSAAGCPDPCDLKEGDTLPVLTQVTAVASSPNGGIYFADATMNRIGVISNP